MEPITGKYIIETKIYMYMTSQQLVENIQEIIKTWAHEPKLATKLIIQEIITYLLTLIKQ